MLYNHGEMTMVDDQADDFSSLLVSFRYIQQGSLARCDSLVRSRVKMLTRLLYRSVPNRAKRSSPKRDHARSWRHRFSSHPCVILVDTMSKHLETVHPCSSCFYLQIQSFQLCPSTALSRHVWWIIASHRGSAGLVVTRVKISCNQAACQR